MKTLSEIKNQTREEKVEILSAFVKEYGREDFGVTDKSLEWLFNRASEISGYAEPYAIEDGFKLYEVDVEYFGNFDGKNGVPHHITVYVADNFNEEIGEGTEMYYSL